MRDSAGNWISEPPNYEAIVAEGIYVYIYIYIFIPPFNFDLFSSSSLLKICWDSTLNYITILLQVFFYDQSTYVCHIIV